MENPPDQQEPEAPIAPPTAEDRIAALEEELANTRDGLLRAVADAQNAQRRAEKQAVDARAFAIDRFAQDLLMVADAMARALDAVPDAGREEEPAKTLLIGVQMTQKSLLDVFEKHGLRRIGDKGEAFDPNRHQAVAQIPSDAPAGAVAEVFQPGYMLHDRTLRAAMVALSLGVGEGQTPAADDPPGGRVDVSA